MVLLLKKIFASLFVFLIALCPSAGFSQLSFKASITPGTIGKNETAELSLMVENASQVEQITPPSLKDFIVIGGPNQQSGMENINGATRQYITISYIIQPRSQGNFTIGQATAVADGKTLKSNRVTLSVTNASSSPNTSGSSNSANTFYDEVGTGDKDYILKKGENILDKINKNIFIKVDVNRTSCYVGEPVVVTYKLYTRLKSESSIIKNPSFNGFSVIDLMPPGNTYYSVEKLGGREYNVYTLRKAQLYPLQPGKAELESSEVENNIHFIKEEYLRQRSNDFDDMFRHFTQPAIPPEGMHDEKVTLRSKPAYIDVKPLPIHENLPAFKGAVGDFQLDASVEKTNFTTDDAGKLQVIIAGEGNMPMVIAPEIQWPDNVEGFDSRAKEQLNKYSVPVSGKKVFEYPFTIAKAGNYILPAINFCYFDPKINSYKTISTKPINVKVKKGSGKSAAVKTTTAYSDKDAFFNVLFHNRWLIIIPLGILIITGLFVWLQKENKRPAAPVAKSSAPVTAEIATATAAPINFKPLALTEEKLSSENPKAFFETLNQEFRKFLADKFGLSLETINRKKIAEEADTKGIPVMTCLRIQHLLDEIDMQLYTPFAEQEKMQELYNAADELVHTLNARV